MWGVPTIYPERSRLAPMVRMLELELPSRRDGLEVELADGRTLLVHADQVLVDGVEAALSPAPAAVLDCLLTNPGHVVSRQALLAALPSGQASSEHAVEMAVARLRAAIGTRAVLTVVKRGYRLAVQS
jgi:uroporphyrinogen-III synthase